MTLNKRSFKPATKYITTDELRIDGYDPPFTFEVLADPPRHLLSEVLDLLGTSTKAVSGEGEEIEKPEQFDARFHEVAAAILVDSDIEGLDFSTPQSTKAAFENEDIDGTLLTRVLVAYVYGLILERTGLKKTQTSATSVEA